MSERPDPNELAMRLARDARDEIEATLHAAPQRVYTRRDLLKTLALACPGWGIQIPPPPDRFLSFLLSETALRRVTLESPNGYRKPTRYVWGQASAHDIAASMGHGVFFCHQSAMELHGLMTPSPGSPGILYVNREQSPKQSSAGSLTQESINRAFARPQRASNYIFSFEGRTIMVLSGKHTGRRGVIHMPGPNGSILDVTDLERTLIDITVRPAYAGGIRAVLSAFMAASGRVSVPKLIVMLKHLQYVYPYHQALGFLLERAGMESKKLIPFKDLGMEFDFFLEHRARQLRYDPHWKIHYPGNL